jgi:hypothetical protein
MLGGTHGVCDLEGFLGMKQHLMPDVSQLELKSPQQTACFFLMYVIHFRTSIIYT